MDNHTISFQIIDLFVSLIDTNKKKKRERIIKKLIALGGLKPLRDQDFIDLQLNLTSEIKTPIIPQTTNEEKDSATSLTLAERQPAKFLFCLFYLFTNSPGLPQRKFRSIEPFLKKLGKGRTIRNFQKGRTTMPLEIIREIQELLNQHPTNYHLRSFIDRWEIGNMLNVPNQPPDPEPKKPVSKPKTPPRVIRRPRRITNSEAKAGLLPETVSATLNNLGNTLTSIIADPEPPKSSSPSIKKRLVDEKPRRKTRHDFDVPHRNPQPSNLLLKANDEDGDINRPTRAIGEVTNFAPGCEPINDSPYVSIAQSRKIQNKPRNMATDPDSSVGTKQIPEKPLTPIPQPSSISTPVSTAQPSDKKKNGFRAIIVGPFPNKPPVVEKKDDPIVNPLYFGKGITVGLPKKHPTKSPESPSGPKRGIEQHLPKTTEIPSSDDKRVVRMDPPEWQKKKQANVNTTPKPTTQEPTENKAVKIGFIDLTPRSTPAAPIKSQQTTPQQAMREKLIKLVEKIFSAYKKKTPNEKILWKKIEEELKNLDLDITIFIDNRVIFFLDNQTEEFIEIDYP